MRKLLFGLAAIAIIVAGIAFVGPLFISTDGLRAALFAQVESATGYRLRVSGPVKISLIPSLDLVAEDVGIAQSGVGEAAELATAKSLRFALQLSALFGGKVKVTEVALIDPVIALPRTKKGAQKAAARQTERGSAIAALQALSLDAFHIENGTLILPPSGGAPGKRIEAFNLEASLPSINAPFAFEASAVVDGKKTQVAGSIGELARLIEGEAVPVALKIDAPSYLDEEATLKGVAAYRGENFALSQFTFRAGGKALSGSASYKGSLLTLHPLTLTVGGNTLSGSVAADLSGAVPAINAAFTSKALNLDALLSKQGASASTGENKQGGWSDDRIDFAALRGITAKFKLSANQLSYNNIKIAQANLQATVKGGRLAATLTKFKLYNGAGTLNVTIDASGKGPAQRVRLSLVNFDAYPFLKDAAGFESIEGTGAVSLDLAASGSSQRAMVSALSGAAKFEFTDGAIRGINIAKTMRNLSTGVLSGWQENAAEKTDFATLGASFKIAKGHATTSDLRLAGPLVRMAGAGNVDLVARTLKFRVDPKLVASLEGQGGKTGLKGLGVPVIVAGPWSKPSIYPDIEGILQNPVAAYEQLNRLGGGLVSLPGAAGADSGIGALIENGKLAPDALQNGAAMGLGRLLGAEPQAKTAPPAGSAAEQPMSEEAVAKPKNGKKRQARRQGAYTPEAVAGRALQSFFGN